MGSGSWAQACKVLGYTSGNVGKAASEQGWMRIPRSLGAEICDRAGLQRTSRSLGAEICDCAGLQSLLFACALPGKSTCFQMDGGHEISETALRGGGGRLAVGVQPAV